MESVKALLIKHADLNELNQAGVFSLQLAVVRGQESVVRLLLDQGAKFDHGDAKYGTPLTVVLEASMRFDLN